MMGVVESWILEGEKGLRLPPGDGRSGDGVKRWGRMGAAEVVLTRRRWDTEYVFLNNMISTLAEPGTCVLLWTTLHDKGLRCFHTIFNM